MGQCVLPKDTDSQTAKKGSTSPSFLDGNAGKPAQPCQGLPPLESLGEHRLVGERDALQLLLLGTGGGFGWTSTSQGAPKRELSLGIFVGGRSSHEV